MFSCPFLHFTCVRVSAVPFAGDRCRGRSSCAGEVLVSRGPCGRKADVVDWDGITNPRAVESDPHVRGLAVIILAVFLLSSSELFVENEGKNRARRNYWPLLQASLCFQGIS